MPPPGIDLHLHLLPGIDDGAPDTATAVAHARRMARAGIVEAACTPHVKAEFPGVEIGELAARTAALQAALDRAGVPLRLHAAGELDWRVAARLEGADLERLALGPPGARWLLLESPFAGCCDGFAGVAHDLLARGYGLVLAHPERALDALAPGSRLPGLEAAGCLLQVNTDSLAGDHGPAVRRAAVALLRSGRAGLLASDGHPGTRERVLTDAARAGLADAGLPGEMLGALVAARPRRLLERGLAPRVARERARGGHTPLVPA